MHRQQKAKNVEPKIMMMELMVIVSRRGLIELEPGFLVGRLVTKASFSEKNAFSYRLNFLTRLYWRERESVRRVKVEVLGVGTSLA